MKTDSEQILHSLKEYGLSNNESLIYIFLLRELESTAFEIAKQTNIPRTTVYTTLESLKRQGFISQIRKNNIAHFSLESTKRLIDVLKRKEDIINDILPQIRLFSSKGKDTPTTKLFLGLKGVEHAFLNILETIENENIKEIYATSQSDLMIHLPTFFPKWIKRRESMGVHTKMILPFGTKNYLQVNNLREIKYMSKDYPFDCSFNIYGNKIAFFSLDEQEQYCMLLESKTIANMFKQFFLFTWDNLSK